MTNQSPVGRFPFMKQHLQHPYNSWFHLHSYNHACETMPRAHPYLLGFSANSIWIFLFISIAITPGTLDYKSRKRIVINTEHSLQRRSVTNVTYLIFI